MALARIRELTSLSIVMQWSTQVLPSDLLLLLLCTWVEPCGRVKVSRLTIEWPPASFAGSLGCSCTIIDVLHMEKERINQLNCHNKRLWGLFAAKDKLSLSKLSVVGVVLYEAKFTRYWVALFVCYCARLRRFNVLCFSLPFSCYHL